MAGVFPSSARMHLRDKCKRRLPWKPATAAEEQKKKEEIYRFLIRFFCFSRRSSRGKKRRRQTKTEWNVASASHRSSYDGFVKGFCIATICFSCTASAAQRLTASHAWTSSSSGKNLMHQMWIRWFSVSFFPLPPHLLERKSNQFFPSVLKNTALKDTHFALCPLAKHSNSNLWKWRLRVRRRRRRIDCLGIFR